MPDLRLCAPDYDRSCTTCKRALEGVEHYLLILDGSLGPVVFQREVGMVQFHDGTVVTAVEYLSYCTDVACGRDRALGLVGAAPGHDPVWAPIACKERP